MKKMRKFSESLEEISADRIEQIKEGMTELSTLITQKTEMIDSLINELNNFRNQSGKSNDQIDDVISNLQLVKKSFDDSVDKLDNVVNDVQDYSKNGRKFLY